MGHSFPSKEVTTMFWNITFCTVELTTAQSLTWDKTNILVVPRWCWTVHLEIKITILFAESVSINVHIDDVF